MLLSTNTQAILLLTGYFNSSVSTEVKPLTVAEWARLADFLRRRSASPSQLLEKDSRFLLEDFIDKSVSKERVDALLKRGTAMAVALEKWSRANIWVVSRADKAYPERLKKRLGQNSPPILYGCGNINLLGQGGLGIVGSRDISSNDLEFTQALGAHVAKSGFSVVSGGAKGVDQAAMLSALEADGTSVGVLADSLLRATTSRQYRPHLLSNNLLLVTPFYPEAGFNAGNAMQRNKYIYCLSDAAVVVHSGNPETSKNGKGGGTWTGALENLKKSWVPLWVKRSDDIKSGNPGIVAAGGFWLSEHPEKIDVAALFTTPEEHSALESLDIFTQAETDSKIDIVQEPQPQPQPQPEPEKSKTETTESGTPKDQQIADGPADRSLISEAEHLALTAPVSVPESFYAYFLMRAQSLLIEPKELDEIVNALEVNKAQLNQWLKQAVKDKNIMKLSRPVRYVWNEALDSQGTLL